jgi:hypothetical protein
MKNKIQYLLLCSLSIIFALACGEDECSIAQDACGGVWVEIECSCDTSTGGDGTYNFSSRFTEGSSVSYSGQIARHALMSKVKSYISSLTDEVQGEGIFEEGAVVGVLNILFECVDEVCNDETVSVSTTPATEQMTIGDISTGKNLKGKLAGNDEVGQHKDWSTQFVGWGTNTVSPTSLLGAWFQMLENRAIAISNGTYEIDPNGEEITKPYVTAEGHDLGQLAQKFLLGAIAFSQGADDDLDDRDDGKGILADNSVAKEGKSYSALEHNWDEGFGYFGAARDYMSYTDDEIAAEGGRDEYQGHHDTDGSGSIDLVSEFNWGHSVNTAKRDRGTSSDLTADAFNAFYQGRTLITHAGGALSEDQMIELKGYRDVAVLAWEKSIAATAIHYVNDTIADMENADYNFYDHAKHWSELKGFALSFQFNPRSPVTGENFARIHDLLGTAPALPGAANFDKYKAGLLEIRAILGDAYRFDTADVEGW